MRTALNNGRWPFLNDFRRKFLGRIPRRFLAGVPLQTPFKFVMKINKISKKSFRKNAGDSAGRMSDKRLSKSLWEFFQEFLGKSWNIFRRNYYVRETFRNNIKY